MLTTSEDSLERLFTDAVADKSLTMSTDSDSAVIERVKKIRDYAFIHFRDRELALVAMDRLNGLINLRYYFVSLRFSARQLICYSALCYRRPSVCPSHGWISQKRLKLGSCNFHRTVAP